MQITQIGHASTLIETQGIRILSDPWWRGPCFGAQWWIYPEPHLSPLKNTNLDYIYISHGHEDHFHPGTLKSLGTSAKILVAESLDLAPHLVKLGYEVLTINEHESRSLGNGVYCRIVPTFGGDTFMILTDGNETLVNLNDSIHPLPRRLRKRFTKRIKTYHQKIDYVFCGHGVASHFPNCYIIPGKDNICTARKRQLFFNHSWAHIINDLSPLYGFPFAADVALLEHDLIWSNQPTHDTQRPPEVYQRLYPDSQVTTLDIAPGFRIVDGHIESMNVRLPLRTSDLQEKYREKIERANRYGTVDESELELVLKLIKQNIEKFHNYLNGFNGDYRANFRFRNSTSGITIAKRGNDFDVTLSDTQDNLMGNYDITYTTRLPYLRRSLTTRYGHETLFVGSGGIFEYADDSRVRENLHEELMAIMRRSGPSTSRLMKNAKRLVKAIINRDDWDMYNLYRWVVWNK